MTHHSDSSQAAWFGETGFAPDHPSQLIADIASTFAETTSDMLIVLDNLAGVDLRLANGEWRSAMATSLERDIEQVIQLVRNAVVIARTEEQS